MRTTALMMVLLVAAALAGCTGGHDTTPQASASPAPSSSGSLTSSGPTPAPHSDNGTLHAMLNVSAHEGQAPLNLTITFDARAPGNVTWTLNVTAFPDNGTSGGNATGNSTGDSTGNSTGTRTGNSTGNATGNSTSSTGTSSTAPTGTGNQTGNATGNSTGNGTGSPHGKSGQQHGSPAWVSPNGTVVASFNGTQAGLPGNVSVLLNASANYRVLFVVHGEGNRTAHRQLVVHVGGGEGPEPGTPLGNETMTKSGSILLGGAEVSCDSFGADVPWVLNATFGGIAADVDHLVVNLTGASTADFALHLLAPNGTEIAHADDNFLGGAEHLDVNGTFPAGNYTIHIGACNAAASSYKVVATAEYVVAKAS